VLNALKTAPLSILGIVRSLKLRSKTGALKRTMYALLSSKYIEYTIADKPASRLQKYRITTKGLARLTGKGKLK
jgi:ATP-dependent DNA helicase RecG